MVEIIANVEKIGFSKKVDSSFFEEIKNMDEKD